MDILRYEADRLKQAYITKREAQLMRGFLCFIALIIAVVFFKAFLLGDAFAADAMLPTPDQLHTSVSDWTIAIDAVKNAWASLGWLWPLLAALPALSKRIQSVPVLGSVLNALAFNFGAAKNA